MGQRRRLLTSGLGILLGREVGRLTLVEVDVEMPLLRQGIGLDQLRVLLGQVVAHGAELIFGELPVLVLARLPVVGRHYDLNRMPPRSLP